MSFLTGIWHALKRLYSERSSPEGARMLASSYWRLLLAIAFVAVAVGIGFAETQLSSIMKNLATPPQTKLPPASLSRNDLNAALASFQNRQKSYDALAAGATPKLQDPSQ